MMLFTVWGVAISADTPMLVSLKSKIYVDKSIVTLGQVADISGVDADTVRELSALNLGKAPRIGYVSKINRTEIERFLRRQKPELVDKLMWHGENQDVLVRSEGRPYPYKQVENAAIDYLKRSLQGEYDLVKILPVSDGDELRLPAGRVEMTPRINSDYLSKRMCVWADILVDGRFYRSLPIWMDVTIQGDVYIARRDIEANETVIEADFERVSKDITMLNGVALESGTGFAPVLTNKAMKEGDVLFEENTREASLVIRERKVNIIVDENGVRLQIQGIALKDANLGETVDVKPVYSEETLKTKVIGKQLVKII